MTKEVLIHQIIDVLSRAGFALSDRCNIRPRSFDVAARKYETLLLCKVLFNIDGLNEETAREMKYLAEYLGGSAIVVGAKTRDQMLEDSVVYMRYDILALNVQTLHDYFVENIPPLVSAAPGGLYVAIEGGLLRKSRTDQSMSLGTLASMVGVSRRTISKYEEEGMDASIDVVLQLEDIFGLELARPIDILKSCGSRRSRKKAEPEKTEPEKEETQVKHNTLLPEDLILNTISMLGYDVLHTAQAPFKAISRDKSSVILTGVSEFNTTVIKRAHLMSSISCITETQSVFIINGHSKLKSVENTVLIEKKELDRISDSQELLEFIEERKENHSGA
ncbi:HTH DNA-binding protein [Methanosarcina lacustris Z-7289]|uniref:Putative HTH-type transcriptional regulatory protein MSLAZ_0747 n=1 Tax=Methanosarcina lacustris Z-7289 TaxID=1434111 RepID=A0A0E3S517_9EURY|nr:transcriptional regulator [Methanosarcina lacustris]AKB74008.1 HTH DNA-binding protein [Methanosarcina lacustris Z-7289]